jgi:hypothetical protein
MHLVSFTIGISKMYLYFILFGDSRKDVRNMKSTAEEKSKFKTVRCEQDFVVRIEMSLRSMSFANNE